MVINILAFGVAKEIMGGSVAALNVSDHATAADVLACIRENYPGMNRLASIALAVNGNYAKPDTIITTSDEVAIIPPVSGG